MEIVLGDRDPVKDIGPVLAVDPGGTTGLCFYSPSDDIAFQHRFEFKHLAEPDHHSALRNYIHWAFDASMSRSWTWFRKREMEMSRSNLEPPRLRLTVILEPFIFRKDDQTRAKIDYTAAEYAGIVKCAAQDHDPSINLVLQPANLINGNAFWADNDRVKQLGLWNPNYFPHGMDALRHFLYWTTFTKNCIDLLRMIKPDTDNLAIP
jgi:hypothetical protein